MRFSVIIPCHNAAPWLTQALQSAARQTLSPHEIIVIDDGSTDDSVAQAWASGVAFRLLSSDHRNAGGTRNVGIQAATGDWIALLDADDVWYPNHLERAAELLGSSGDVAFMSSHDWINVRGETVPIPPGYRCSFTQPTSKNPPEKFIDILEGGLHFGHSTVVYRRDRVLDLGGFNLDQKRRHDIDLWLRMIHGHTWAYDTVKSAGYREDTPDSLSKNLPECEYYYLWALLKSRAHYPGPVMERLIATSARRAMSLSFVDGSAQEHARVRELAWPHLTPAFQTAYRLAAVCPPVLRSMIRCKRALRNRYAALLG